jgi:hypothetical protein
VPPPPTIDNTPPKVETNVPADGAPGVSPTVNVKAAFSKDMLVSSINGKTSKLFKKGSTTKVAATVSYDDVKDTATLDPTNNLRSGVTYKAVVTTGAKNLAGNPLEQQQRWFFAVG